MEKRRNTIKDDVEIVNYDVKEPVVILGFGQKGQVLANFLSTPLASGLDDKLMGCPYVAFDLNPGVVKAARKLGFPIFYGDGSRPAVLQAAGISSPKAVVIMYTGKERTLEAIQRIHLAFPAVPIYARAKDLSHLLDLKKAGATDAILESAETSLQLGSKLLKGLGAMSDDVTFLSQLIRDSMEIQAQETQNRIDERDFEVMKPMQVTSSSVLRENNQGSFELPSGATTGTNQLLDEQTRANQNGRVAILKSKNPEDCEKGVTYCELEIPRDSSNENGDSLGGMTSINSNNTLQNK